MWRTVSLGNLTLKFMSIGCDANLLLSKGISHYPECFHWSYSVTSVAWSDCFQQICSLLFCFHFSWFANLFLVFLLSAGLSSVCLLSSILLLPGQSAFEKLLPGFIHWNLSSRPMEGNLKYQGSCYLADIYLKHPV